MSTINTTGVVNQSITRIGRNEPFELQVARGQITGHSLVNIFGYFTTPAAAGTFRTAWELGGTTAYAFPSSAVTMTITGTASDTAQILVSGLDATYNPISETVTLNGSTGVPTVNKYFRINSLQVTAGSATNPAGIVTCTNGGVTYAQINAGVGQSQMAVYTVPAGCTFYLTRIDGFTSFNGNTTNYINYRDAITLSSGVSKFVAQSPFNTNYQIKRITPLPFPAGTDIQYQFAPSAAVAAVVSIFVEGYLVQNDGAL